jgi:uncharacterized membrane protein YoaK (UPF0700 family)
MTGPALRCLAIIGLFVVGVMAGTIIRRLSPDVRARVAVLAAVSVTLGVAALLGSVWSRPRNVWSTVRSSGPPSTGEWTFGRCGSLL